MSSTLLSGIRSPEWDTQVASSRTIAVLLHGFGSNERDLTGLVPALGLALPWVSLRAPLDLGNGGAAWFEIITPGNPDAAPVMQATEAIWAWVDAHAGPDSQIVPIGFSQGGLMASQLLRNRPDRVLAPVVLGGFVLGAAQPGDAALAATRPPLFWGRGVEDRVIGPAAIERTSTFLPEHTDLLERVYPGLAHGISADEIEDVRNFLTVHVGEEAVLAR